MTEKKKGGILIGLLAVAGLVFYLDRNISQGISRNSPGAPYTPLAVDSLGLRVDKLDSSRKTEYKSSGRDLFTEVVAAAPRSVPKDPDVPNATLPKPLPPPEAPKLPSNVKYFGWGTIPNGTLRRGFLTDGEIPFVVGEGDVFLGKYRILRIGSSLEFEDISTGMRGTAPLEEQAAPPA